MTTRPDEHARTLTSSSRWERAAWIMLFLVALLAAVLTVWSLAPLAVYYLSR